MKILLKIINSLFDHIALISDQFYAFGLSDKLEKGYRVVSLVLCLWIVIFSPDGPGIKFVVSGEIRRNQSLYSWIRKYDAIID